MAITHGSWDVDTIATGPVPLEGDPKPAPTWWPQRRAPMDYRPDDAMRTVADDPEHPDGQDAVRAYEYENDESRPLEMLAYVIAIAALVAGAFTAAVWGGV